MWVSYEAMIMYLSPNFVITQAEAGQVIFGSISTVSSRCSSASGQSGEDSGPEAFSSFYKRAIILLKMIKYVRVTNVKLDNFLWVIVRPKVMFLIFIMDIF